ncbi:MAG: hypothetical protein E6Q34_02995 [Burkholderiaceae bacterium]|nr:MAG: hypothetical protein E6Q34_02995 [Burkholderiaceae bacterium]
MWFRLYFYASLTAYAVQSVYWILRLLFGLNSFFWFGFMPYVWLGLLLWSALALLALLLNGHLRRAMAPLVFIMGTGLAFGIEQLGVLAVFSDTLPTYNFGLLTPYLELVVLFGSAFALFVFAKEPVT